MGDVLAFLNASSDWGHAKVTRIGGSGVSRESACERFPVLAEGGYLPPLLGPSQLDQEGRRESLGLAIAGQPECL